MDIVNHKLCVQCMTYNHASFITQTMDGFCMQKTNFPYVCCIIDDASIDGEQFVLSDYLYENFLLSNGVAEVQYLDLAKIVYARHKKNENCYFVVVFLKKNLYADATGYQKKLAMIAPWRDKCEYEAMCEGDDYWTNENKLQMQVDFLDKHLDYSICSHRIKRFDQDEQLFWVDRLGPMFVDRKGIDFNNRSKVWISETSTIVFRLAAHKEYDLSPCQRRDNVHVYYLLKYGKGFCFSDVMSVYRLHKGGIYAKQDLNTKLVNGGYKALKQLYKYERTADARFLYYRCYALAFLLTQGRILVQESFNLRKFLSLPYYVLSIATGIHPVYQKEIG